MTDTPYFAVTPEPKHLLEDIRHHIVSYLGNDFEEARKDTYYHGLALSIRERLSEQWLKTQRYYYEKNTKRVYYLSLEFLPGRFLLNNILKLQLMEPCRQALKSVGLNLEDVAEEEWDPGIGNGGLGRLASCYLDSMATLGIAGYSYGIRYDYGIFFQEFHDGYQVEKCDNWLRNGSAWEFKRQNDLFEVKFYGRTVCHTQPDGVSHFCWEDADNVMALACDYLIPGLGNGRVNNMRLWSAVSSREFNLQDFQNGDYIGAMEAKVLSETISKVLYPKDETSAGKELRLKQQYFLVAATFKDILRRFRRKHSDFATLSEEVAIQLNDTHPSIAIAELMRILLNEEALEWKAAWRICTRTFAYTNHTVLPEALESWSVELLGRVLPRHMDIISEINRQFMMAIEEKYPGDTDRQARMAIVYHGQVRMAHLAIVGSHSVNGVSELHTRILKQRLFKDFHEFYPGKLKNVTNGITPRRWILQVNPDLSNLITDTIGSAWVQDLNRLRELVPYAEDPGFIKKWRTVKQENKKRLAAYIQRTVGLKVDPESLFDVQIKRIHEYKRQLLNILHVITLYNRLKADPQTAGVPRTFIFGGKAAPGYYIAKLIIKLINSVAEVINTDDDIAGQLKMVFLPNYCVTQAEKIVPAADLSEQISTAGMEASGTGNMKLSLNGALTIGTLDGANVEIMEEVGEENIFIFGLKADEVDALRSGGRNPKKIYEEDPELKKAVSLIDKGFFSPDKPDLFAPIVDSLIHYGDYYMVLSDYRTYVETQKAVDRLYLQPDKWARQAILNTANMGKFSSDRAIREYAEKIWNVKPVE